MPAPAGKAGAAAKPKKGKKSSPEGVSIPGFCDALKGVATLNELTGKNVKKGEAALALWSYALRGENQREEIFKAGCMPNVVSMLDRSDCVEDRLAAMGLVAAMALSEKHILEVVTTKVITCAVALLQSEHARSKLPAVKLLAHIAPRPEYQNRVADQGMLPLLEAIRAPDPGWAQHRMTQLHALQALRALVENVQADNPLLKNARRALLIQHGAIPSLVELVGYVPRMPEPEVCPAPPPPVTKAGKIKPVKGAPGVPSGKGKKGKKAQQGPGLGRRDTIATLAAACLRFLALCPNFTEELIASGSLEPFVGALTNANEEQAAFLSGILWEITAEQEVARLVMDCSPIKGLLHVVSRFMPAAAAGRKPRKKKKKEGAADDKKKRAPEAPPPPSLFDVAVCNAAGALHHLTFMDDAKIQVGKANGLAILAAATRVGNPQTYENAVGALWNCGLDLNNVEAMAATAVPEFLAVPVPHAWLMDGRYGPDGELLYDSDGESISSEGGEEEGVLRYSTVLEGAEGADDLPATPGRTFLTQQQHLAQGF